MTILYFYIIAIVLLAALFVILSWMDAVKKQFYANPVGKRCRYLFRNKWIKGKVDWANGPYYYITPKESHYSTDLINRKNVRPVYL